jgi:hypothetical protein
MFRCKWADDRGTAGPEHGNVRTLPAAIGMQLVEHQEIETVGVGDDRAVERVLPGHQQLEHHEIGEQDVGLRLANSLALLRAFLARIASKRRPQMVGQSGLLDELVDLLALAVCQRIHWIDHDCPRARWLARLAGADRSINDRNEKAE